MLFMKHAVVWTVMYLIASIVLILAVAFVAGDAVRSKFQAGGKQK